VVVDVMLHRMTMVRENRSIDLEAGGGGAGAEQHES
jgi:hypothetical protein